MCRICHHASFDAGNTPPTVTGGSFDPVRAGFTATYSAYELLQAVSASDTDQGDSLKVSKVALKLNNQGDRLSWKDDNHVQYYCSSAGKCSNGGNNLLVTVSDGEAAVTGTARQPVTTRPGKFLGLMCKCSD